MKQLVGLCIGHSRLINGRPEGGAVAADGTNEWHYNLGLAEMIAGFLMEQRIPSVTVAKYDGTGYGSAQRWLAGHLEDIGVTVAVELHFNAADDPAANGHEWLYWHASANGKRLATSLDAEICLQQTGTKRRGPKPRFAGDRGAEFLRFTHCPAVICEPFFGSNAGDWQAAQTHKAKIARGIAEGIADYLDGP